MVIECNNYTCIKYRHKECTGDRISCLEYNNEQFRLYIKIYHIICFLFRYYLFSLAVVTKMFNLLFLFTAYKTYKLPNNQKSKTVEMVACTGDNFEDVSLK